ncbi:MAG TPA: transcriptional regulator [Pirellulales bacterium]|jgi:DNA-binding MarR family transcriptional regulator|nr:transcriptional regulator [Pirellulales bacterium]
MGRTSRQKSPDNTGRFAYDKLERVIHERARLGIMTSLVSSREGLPFADLKQLCGLTDGNLNRHLDVLRAEGLIEIRKEPSSGRARTICRVTPAGKTRFLEYLDELERVVADAAAAAQAARAPATSPSRRLSTA